MESDRSDPDVYARRGDSFLASGLLHDAIADYGRALDRGVRDRARVLRQRASCKMRLSRYPEAHADLSESLEVAPTSPEGLLARAQCGDVLGMDAEVVRDLEEFLRRSPDHAEAMALLAWNLLAVPPERRQTGRALVLARRAARDLPRYWGARRTLGVACYMNSLRDEAKENLEEAIRLPNGEKSPSAFLYLALIRAAAGDTEGGRAAYRNAEALGRRAELYPTVRKRVEAMIAEVRAALPREVLEDGPLPGLKASAE